MKEGKKPSPGKSIFTFKNVPRECRPESIHGHLKRQMALEVERLVEDATEVFGSYVKSVLLFGSIIDPARKSTAFDIDVAFVIEDPADSDKEVRNAIEGKIGEMADSINKRIHTTTMFVSDFWRSFAKSEAFTINLLNNCIVMYDLGFINPLRSLAAKDTSHGKKLKADRLIEASATLLKLSEITTSTTFIQSIEPAVISSSQAVLVELGVDIPSPSQVPDLVRDLLKNRLSYVGEEECKLVDEFVTLYQQIRRGEPILMGYGDLQGFLHSAKEYFRTMKGVLKLIRQNNTRREAEAEIKALPKASKDTKDVNICMKMGEKMLTAGKLEGAIPWLERALNMDPQNEKAWFLKKNALHSLELPKKELRCCDIALDRIPIDAKIRSEFLLAKGQILISMGLEDAALQCLSLIKGSDEHFRDAISSQLGVHKRHGRYDEAIELIDRLLRATPKDKQVINQKANLLYLANRKDDCKKLALENNLVEMHKRSILTTFFETKDDLARAWSNLAMMYIFVQDFNNALIAAKNAVELSPNANRLDSLGVALMNLGRLDEAVLAFDQCLALSKPSHEDYLEHRRNRDECLRRRSERSN